MAKVQINSWEDGDVEGVFDTVEEAEAYVLEEEMDVVVYDFSGLNGKGYRFNTEIAERRKKDAEYEVDQTLLGFGSEVSKEESEEGWK